MKLKQSAYWAERSRKRIPGGVNSPVRAFRAVGGEPIFIASAHGSRITDVDGNEYIDYVGSWGPMILGHAHPEVVAAVREAALRGTSYGAPTIQEALLAETIGRFFPSIEQVRLVNSGTEATMSAIRLARAFSGKSMIVKFDGCYHGHSDSLLVQAGSGVATLGLPDSPGVPESVARETLTLPFNDLVALEQAFQRYPNQIGGVILEPVTGNMGVVLPQPSFLSDLLNICQECGAIAIFDEVMTGFRVAAGGAQERFAVSAPLTCLGKIVGGGLPIGAYGGSAEIMESVAPQGPVYQAGTLSGNPLAVAAGLKTLEILEREKPHNRLEELTSRLCEGLKSGALETGVPLQVHQCGSMFTAFFSQQTISDFRAAKTADTDRFSRFFQAMLERGIYLAPSQFEAGFVSLAHSEDDIERTTTAALESLKEISHERG